MRKLLLYITLIISQVYYAQSDCISAIPVCGNSNISYTPLNSGTIQEDLMGCLLSDEHYSVWYSFTIATSGTLTFEITPNVYVDDYDFGVYGPNQTCGALSPPIRCNYSPADGPTGLSPTLNGQNTSGAYSAYMDVVAGETYYLVVDNWSNTVNGFSLTWGGTATLTSAFNDPSITPNPFLTPGQPGSTSTSPNEILKCALPIQFDFSTLTNGILNGNTNFTVTFHNNNNDAITGNAPLTIATIDGTTIYYFRVEYTDSTNPDNPANGCFQTGLFKFRQGNIVANDATLSGCNNNNAGTATYNLLTADVFGDPTATKKFYPTLADLNAGTNEITNPTAYVSSPKTIYVLVTSVEGCTDTSEITLNFRPVVELTPATIESCFIEGAITTAVFNLNEATVTNNTDVTKRYFNNEADALAGINEISNSIISTSRVVYVRVTNSNGCYTITKITLVVIPPVKSSVLKDKTICVEDRTSLDAGPGFEGYEWSTGATTQTIHGVSVGTYWVKLKTGKCYTLQEVNVYASNQPVISSIDIKNNNVTVNVSGGNAPYQYSLDGINWQDSNQFIGLKRGENKFFVKDSYNCSPVQVQITIPNLVNVITPNGDNVNDEVDYTALAYKKNLVFTVYNRYGNKIYEADKIRNYKWNGTSSGKKVSTGTYWYTITWNEDNPNKTQIKYDGWILVKNRE